MNSAPDIVELLAFGPNLDDIGVGISDMLAKHAALRHSVDPCNLAASEMGGNDTVVERFAEDETARGVLGARWRTNLLLGRPLIGTGQ